MEEQEFARLLEETMSFASGVSAQLQAVRYSYDLPHERPVVVQWVRDTLQALNEAPDLYDTIATSELPWDTTAP